MATLRKFDKLPNHLVVKIFEYLTVTEKILIERVCKQWNCLAVDSWSKYHRLYSWSLPKTSGAIEKVLSLCGKYLTTLEIRRYDDADPENILSLVAQRCPNLVKFSFKQCNFPNLDVQLSNIFRNCLRLTTLDLSENENLTGSCFIDIPPELTSMALNSCFHVRNEYIEIFSGRCSNLEILILNGCNQLTMACLKFTFQKLTKLRVLKFRYYSNTQQLQAQFLPLSYLNQLREIKLSLNCCVNDETLNLICRSCSYVKEIDISWTSITDMGLFYLRKLKHLTNLDLSFCSNITDVGVQLLMELDGLEVLNLHKCQKVTDDSVIKIAERCPNLTWLDLQYTGVTDASVWAFYNNADKKKTIKLVLFVKGTKVSLIEESHWNLQMLFVVK